MNRRRISSDLRETLLEREGVKRNAMHTAMAWTSVDVPRKDLAAHLIRDFYPAVGHVDRR